MIQLYKIKESQFRGKDGNKKLLTLKEGFILIDGFEGTAVKVSDKINNFYNEQLFGPEIAELTDKEKERIAFEESMKEFDDVELKDDIKKEVIEMISSEFDNLNSDNTIKGFEKDLFDIMYDEAIAYIDNKEAKIPTITIIAKSRGITVLQQAKKIVAKKEAEINSKAENIGLKYRAKDKLDIILSTFNKLKSQYLTDTINDEMTEAEIKIKEERSDKLIQSLVMKHYKEFISDKTDEEIIQFFVEEKNKILMPK